MVDLKFFEVGESDYTSPMILVEAPGKNPRPCIDYRRLNKLTLTMYYPLPNLEDSRDCSSCNVYNETVLKRIEAANFSLKPSKCKFARDHVLYLGHTIGQGSRRPSETKVQAVVDFLTPKTKTDVRAFLGLSG
ncbi:Transposon Ty3-G Gag-Pol polyprotein like [Argiope bruennichi]|uniref:Transposon Ty3-G Gag-Pol polyprotein like n=1 Tax=Argiope bruennichi TaxID=94029 RepID=A0A8T0E202_ARGBR|nr:Transposon Ty3-G Gag-Pol polyprotein like [Argiope bruennichi]